MSWNWDAETLAALTGFLKEKGLYCGAPNPRPIGDGHSNLTYMITAGDGALVLRRPPPPPIPKGANDVMREAKVMAALEHTDVAVPKVLATSHAGEVLDVPFYIMDHVKGHVITDELPDGFDAKRDGTAMAYGFVDALAHLHNVDWQGCGLDKFGRPEGFNARHLSRMEGLMQARKDPVPAPLRDMANWLKSTVPDESGAAIVHNDFRLGNVMWSDAPAPRLLAVLDWELATIGDPLLDLGYMAVCYPEKGVPLTPTQELSAVFLAPGFPDQAQIFERYSETSGRDLSGLAWYSAMAAWKMAVLFDYSHRQGRDAFYADPMQATRFLEAAERFVAKL